MRGPWLAVAAITAVGLALRAAIPPIFAWDSPHDDEGLMRIAASIMNGEWLGVWGTQQVPHITLAKGPGYSLFLVSIHWTGLGPCVAAYALYLVGALLLAVALRPQLGHRWFVALYGLLALNPVVFSTQFSQVYRDQLVAGLSLLSLGLGAHLATLYTRREAWSWRRVGGTVAETLALGLVTGWLAITRGDVIWITLATAGAFAVVLLANRQGMNPRSWLRVGVGAVMVVIFALGPPLGVALLNERYYGVRLVDDYSQGSFAEALTLWSSVEVLGSSDFTPVSAEQRAAVYAVSPTAQSLETRLEDPANPWISHGCTFQADTAIACDDYGAYLTWAIRDAVIQEGMATTAAEFQDFFQRIADEIEAACGTGELSCGARGLSPDVPALDRISKRVILANLAGHINGSLNYNTGTRAQTLAPDGDPAVPLWYEIVNGADTAAALVASGNHPATISQTNLFTFLAELYTWLTTSLALVAIVAAFTRTMWTSPLGRLAFVALAGWLGNLFIVSLFFAAANRTHGNAIVLYTMSSQSYMIAGLTLTAVVVGRKATRRFVALATTPTSGSDEP